MTKRDRMYQRIRQHGETLQAIFGLTGDPSALCKRLRRLECSIRAAMVRYCNGEIGSDAADVACEDAKRRLLVILGDTEANRDILEINRDPRGYALKIADGYMRSHDIQLYRDWGGYGIIAPDFSDAE